MGKKDQESRTPTAPEDECSPLSLHQQSLLQDFSRLAGRPALNRPFILTGTPPLRRAERKDLVIATSISDDELLSLAKDGYISYRARDNSIAFCAKAFDRQAQIESMPSRYLGARGIRLGQLHLTFGKYRMLTFVRPAFVLLAAALGILYLVGVITTTGAQTWSAVVGLLLAALALQLPQQGKL